MNQENAMRRFRRQDEQGSVLVMTLLTLVVATALTLVIVASVISVNRSSGVTRQQSVAVSASEAGVDAAYASIQNSALTLPCSWPVSGTASTATAPDKVSVSAVIKYTSVANSTPRCPLAVGEKPVAAVITSTAQTQVLSGGSSTAKRTFQSSVNMTPIYGNGFDSAIFGDKGIVMSNNGGVTGANADLYTNGDFECKNGSNRVVQGSVFAQGRIIWDDKCRVDGTAWAAGAVLKPNNNQLNVGGDVKSGTGPVTLGDNATITGKVFSGGPITWSGCTSGVCVSNGSPSAPMAKPFPRWNDDWDSLQRWETGGFQRLSPPGGTPCADVPAWIQAGASVWGTKTLVEVTPTCTLAMDNSNNNWSLKSDLVVMARGGFKWNNATDFTTAAGVTTTKNLYFIVPYSAGTPSCSIPEMTAKNQTTTSALVSVMMYSPCNISIANNSTLNGQVYSGSVVDGQNSFDLQYKQLPVFGVDPNSLPTLSYRLDVLYKREQN